MCAPARGEKCREVSRPSAPHSAGRWREADRGTDKLRPEEIKKRIEENRTAYTPRAGVGTLDALATLTRPRFLRRGTQLTRPELGTSFHGNNGRQSSCPSRPLRCGVAPSGAAAGADGIFLRTADDRPTVAGCPRKTRVEGYRLSSVRDRRRGRPGPSIRPLAAWLIRFGRSRMNAGVPG